VEQRHLREVEVAGSGAVGSPGFRKSPVIGNFSIRSLLAAKRSPPATIPGGLR
jgi:hypothetical protein